MTLTTSELCEILESLDPTGKLPVYLARSNDLSDSPLENVLTTTQAIVLWPRMEEELAQHKFAIDNDDEGLFAIHYYAPWGDIRVGPTTYDFLVAESVVKSLYEQLPDFLAAFSANDADNFVTEVFNEYGGA